MTLPDNCVYTVASLLVFGSPVAFVCVFSRVYIIVVLLLVKPFLAVAPSPGFVHYTMRLLVFYGFVAPTVP